MVNILFVTGSLSLNGTETFIMNVYRCLDKTKFHADFLLSNGKRTCYYEEVESNGSRIYLCSSRREAPVKSYLELYRFFKQTGKRYDALHYCCGSLTSIAPIIFACLFGIPVRIIHAHNSNCTGLHNKILHFLQCPIANILATHRLACSDKAANFFSSFSKKYIILNNGVDVNKFSFNREKRNFVRKTFGISDNEIVIGHVGRFNIVKNHSFILRIFSSYLRENPKSRLMLIGEGELEGNIKELAKDLGLMEHVMFLGLRQDIPDLLQAMDLFLMPSIFEGLPFVLVEAQSSGLPCVISDRIDKNVDITNNVVFLGLDQPYDRWSFEMTRILNKYKRGKTDELINKAGYSVLSTTKILEKIYQQE